ncbi:MAG: hypothetical protein ABUL69_04775 [Peristeroidobacter soli]
MTTNKILFALLAATAAGSAHADVTVNTTTTGKAIIDVSGTSVIQIKGTRERNESVMSGKSQALIIDIDGRRFVSIDDKKKSATVTPLDAIADDLQKVGVGTINATLTKTAQTKTIAGYPCTVHDVKLSLPFSPTGQTGQGLDLTMLLTGTVCLSTTAPGLADYQKFYKAAADSGFIFGDPKVAKTPTGAAQAKAYAEITRKMAEGGMALESQINIDATGDSPMAGLFSKAAKSHITTTVTSVVAGDVAADKFEVPAGYKVKTQK